MGHEPLPRVLSDTPEATAGGPKQRREGEEGGPDVESAPRGGEGKVQGIANKATYLWPRGDARVGSR